MPAQLPVGRHRRWLHLAAPVLLAVAALAVSAVSAVSPQGPEPGTSQEPGPVRGIGLPVVQLHWEAGQLRLSGRLPDEAERQALMRTLRTVWSGTPLDDGLELAAVGNPNWLRAAFLPDLRGATRAHARLHDATLVIEAEAASAAVRERIVASTRQAREAGLRVEVRWAPAFAAGG